MASTHPGHLNRNLPRRIRPLLAIFPLLLALLLALTRSASRADDPLPAGLCVLISGRVICYDSHSGSPVPATPINDPVTDFAPSPDGQWLAYRAALPGDPTEKLYLAPISTAAASVTIIDPQATPPADLRLNATTLAWAPNGIALAYVTAFGLRVSVPGGHSDATDQAYVSVLWSADSARLAAQGADGGWTFFAVNSSASSGIALTVLRRFSQSAAVAWFDLHSVIAAPISGGLLRLDVNANTPPLWTIADEHFIHLQTGIPGEVLAIHIVPGEPNGLAVGIDSAGHWTAFGSARLDPQLTWGPAPGNRLVYITSGTPIMVDRATASEDMLPINHADRLVWRYGDLPEAAGVVMDADLYFIAPDASGVDQVWRLPRDGFPLLQLTNSPVAVTHYDIGPDAVRYTAGNGGQSALAGLNGPTLTPLPTHTGGSAPRATIPPTVSATSTSRAPFLTVTPAVINQAYALKVVGWQPGPVVVQRIGAAGSGSGTQPTALIESALLSPGGQYAVGFRAGRLLILNWATGQLVAVQGIPSARDLRWAG